MDDVLKDIQADLDKVLDRLDIYLGEDKDERSHPADLLATVLHRYAQGAHPGSDFPFATLGDVIEIVREAREDSDFFRDKYREEYGEGAGDLLASMNDVAGSVAPRFRDRWDVNDAASRYHAKLDRHFGERAGLPGKQKIPKNAESLELYHAAIEEAIMLYWKHPERFVVNLSTAEISKESVFEHVAPKYGLEPKTLYNRYNAALSSEVKARLAKRARKKRRTR